MATPISNQSSKFTGNAAGLSAPKAPVVALTAGSEGVRRDPSSTRQSGMYPIPSFFEYRVYGRTAEVV